MNTALHKIFNDTLRFNLSNHGVLKTDDIHQTKGWIIQPADVLAYIPRGKGEIAFRESGKVYKLVSGETILSNGGAVRKNKFTPENGELVIWWIYVRYEILNRFNLLKLFYFPKVFRAETSAKIGALIQKLIENTSVESNVSFHKLAKEKALGLELLAVMLSECELRENAMSLLEHYRKQADLIDYIEDNLKKKISVADLARRSSLSVSRFHRVFKQAAGRSPTEFIIDRRVCRAKHLLVTTDMSLTEISDETGFANVYYFSRVFKQYSGMSPAAYRNLQENQLVF